MTPSRARAEQREHWEPKHHLAALDDDVDTIYDGMRELRETLKSELGGMRKILIGILITFSGTSLGFALNVILRAV